MSFDQARRAADKRLRRDILRLIESASAAGGMRGRFLADVVASTSTDPIEDDDHLMGLLLYLVQSGYATQTDLRRYKHERRGLDTLLYAIAPKGTALIAEAIDPDPMIEDPRI